MSVDRLAGSEFKSTCGSHAAARGAVLVVVPVLNEAWHIESVLSQLSTKLPSDSPVRFVVVDGGSSDATADIVLRLAQSNHRIAILNNPGRLQSAAVNRAVTSLGADFSILIRCDAHSHYPAGFISDLIRTIDQTQADAVVVPMDSVGDTCLRKAIAWISDTVVGSGGAAHRGGYRSGFVDHGHHAAFRMATFVAVGGYDESFSHNEDAELDCRQRAIGARIYLDSTIRIGYVPRGTLRALGRQYFAYGGGRSRTVRKHPKSMRLRQFAVPTHVSITLLCLFSAPWHPVLAVWPLLYGVALCIAAGIVVVRHRDLCGFFAVPAALTMHFAWAFGFLFGMVARRQKRWSIDEMAPLDLGCSPPPDETAT